MPVVGTVFASGILKLIGYVVLDIAIARITKAMQKKPTRRLQKVDANYAGGLEPRRKLYGYFRAGGLDTMPSIVTGPTGTRLHKLLTMSDGQIQSIDAVWFNNDRLTGSWVGGATTGAPYSGAAYVSAHLGLVSQSADSAALAIPGWTTFHRLDGVAYVYMFFDQNDTIWKGNTPLVVIEGQGAIVYDPRLDTSPGAHPTNASYIAFTTNPALITADYLQWGGGELAANIDWNDVVTVANICDQTVSNVPDDLGGSTTQKRFTCSVECYAPQTLSERDETIKMFARAFMGAVWWSGAKWHMRAGAYTSSVRTLVDDDFLGDSIEIATAQPRSAGGIFNTVRGSYVEQGQNTQPKPMPEVSSATYVSQDGEVIYTDADFKTARTVYEAERNAILLLRQTRRRIIIAAAFRFKAWKLQLYDVVTVTCSKIGWSAQTARIIGIRLRPNFMVELRMQEIDSSDFNDPLLADYITPNAIAVPIGDSYRPNPASNLSAQSAASAIILSWSPPVNAPVGVLYRVYEYSSSTPFSSAVQNGNDTPQTSIVIPRTSTATGYFWVVAVDPQTLAVSTQSPPSNGVPAAAASASSALGAVVTPGSATVSGYTSSLTTPTVTVTPTGGTPGYTYATTAISGGTGITTNNGSTASPSWTATGLAEGDVKSGTYRIRVTDSVAAIADVLVAVTISRLFGVTLTNTTITAIGAAGGPGYGGSPAVATYVVANDGNIYPSPGGGSYQWKNPSALASAFDVRFTLLTGTIDTGTTGVWLNLASAQQLTKVRSPGAGSGTSTATVTVEIRDASTLTVLGSCTLTMNCTIP